MIDTVTYPLEQFTEEEQAHFLHLNEAYTGKFGFPFIIAVKGLTKSEIRQRFEQRLTNNEEQEFTAALQEVKKIARLRLQGRLPS